jgi:FeS assembly SUF system protein
MDTKPQRVPLELEKPVAHLPAAAGPPTTAPSEVTPVSSAETTGPVDVQELEDKVLAALRTCYDPEIPINIYELGLVYDIEIAPPGAVTIKMTLTSPACPVAGSLPGEVQAKVQALPGVTAAHVDLVWDPPWDQDRMSEAAKLQLGLF